MAKDVDHLLARAPILEEGPALGRIFSVVRESWLLTEDPRLVSPRTEIVATRRTALDAAELARCAAACFERHGFHKSSGAWWGSDGVRLHRFAVRTRRSTRKIVLWGSALAAMGAVVGAAVLDTARRSRRKARSRA